MGLWQHAAPGTEARLFELADLCGKSRAVFFDIAQDEQHWSPGAGSLAHRDLANSERGPGGPWGEAPVRRMINVVGNYLLIATGHLGGLAVLYAGQEVLFSPSLLVRAVIENCARVVWILAIDQPGATRGRVARAYLEELLSAEEAKTVTGRLGEKSTETYDAAASAYRLLRDTEIPALFEDVTREELGKKTLSGQQLLSPEACVVWMYEQISAIGASVSGRQGQGAYGFLSNMTHPTLYPVREMTDWHATPDGHVESHLAVDLPFLEKLTGAAVVGFFNGMSLLMSYMGWDSAKHSEWERLIDKTLPGTFTGP